ncbi:MAG: hypothetical protein WD603_02060 [Patescibacteria group bacterium]
MCEQERSLEEVLGPESECSSESGDEETCAETKSAELPVEYPAVQRPRTPGYKAPWDYR